MPERRDLAQIIFAILIICGLIGVSLWIVAPFMAAIVWAATIVVATPFQETNGAVSPDGTLLAHESDEVDGVFNVYVRSFPEGSEKIRASTRGGRQPRWGVDGRLFFWSSSAGRIESVRIGWKDGHLVADEAQPVLDPQVARTLARHLVVGAGDGFDPGRSGRFLVLESAADPSPPALGRPVVVVRRR